MLSHLFRPQSGHLHTATAVWNLYKKAKIVESMNEIKKNKETKQRPPPPRKKIGWFFFTEKKKHFSAEAEIKEEGEEEEKVSL